MEPDIDPCGWGWVCLTNGYGPSSFVRDCPYMTTYRTTDLAPQIQGTYFVITHHNLGIQIPDVPA